MVIFKYAIFAKKFIAQLEEYKAISLLSVTNEKAALAGKEPRVTSLNQ